MSRPPMLEVEGLTKTFPGVVANADVSFKVEAGEIHALLGENGAGKSTLVKMIYGALQPDAGVMTLDGAPFAPAHPAAARAAGIGMVFQHFTLFDALTVAENVILGLSSARAGRNVADEIRQVAATYGLNVDPGRLAGTLSVGERQRVEIVRCLMQSPKLLIMDEPTSVLTPAEADAMFVTLRRLRDEGRAIMYISHKLEEIVALCDRVTILRQGRTVGACDPGQETPRRLAEMMLGDVLRPPQAHHRKTTGDRRLRVEKLSLESTHMFGVALEDVTLDVEAGEIVGIAGVAGNGQTELMEALIGERTAPAGTMILGDVDISRLDPTERRRRGMAFVPEERLGHAAAPDFTLWENALITAEHPRGWLDVPQARAAATDIVEAFSVRTAGIDRAASSLSGGNLQKFSIGREIRKRPRILIVAQPTWGVDAGAASDIQRALLTLAEDGSAILVISQDLSELMGICDRIAVMSAGRLTPLVPTTDVTVEQLGRAMGTRGNADTGASYA